MTRDTNATDGFSIYGREVGSEKQKNEKNEKNSKKRAGIRQKAFPLTRSFWKTLMQLWKTELPTRLALHYKMFYNKTQETADGKIPNYRPPVAVEYFHVERQNQRHCLWICLPYTERNPIQIQIVIGEGFRILLADIETWQKCFNFYLIHKIMPVGNLRQEFLIICRVSRFLRMRCFSNLT